MKCNGEKKPSCDMGILRQRKSVGMKNISVYLPLRINLLGT